MENLSLTSKEFKALQVNLTQFKINIQERRLSNWYLLHNLYMGRPDEAFMEIQSYNIPYPYPGQEHLTQDYLILISHLYQAINSAIGPSMRITYDKNDLGTQHMVFTQADQDTLEIHLSGSTLTITHYCSGQLVIGE